MPDTVERLPYTPALDPCPRCGAWKWTDQAADLFIRDMVRCGECNHEARREDLTRRADGA